MPMTCFCCRQLPTISRCHRKRALFEERDRRMAELAVLQPDWRLYFWISRFSVMLPNILSRVSALFRLKVSRSCVWE